MTPQDPAPRTPVRAAVSGSCVSRDTSAIVGNLAVSPRELNDVINVPEVRADPDRVWGLAPFHYSPDVYAEILLRLAEDFDALPKSAVKDVIAASGEPAEDKS
ncbi:hypothetical protein [Nesterenkonia marinintestina]|uniref:hypothetical protein n=1 Tax=Nesterenkonia marinintestina TaxID=2979865 RepID=UPI0021C0E050|nr:hypothetical protein [Nesterenkonia sp. GX14115]